MHMHATRFLLDAHGEFSSELWLPILISKANKNPNNKANKSDGQCCYTVHFLNLISRDSIHRCFERNRKNHNQCDNNAHIDKNALHSTPMQQRTEELKRRKISKSEYDMLAKSTLRQSQTQVHEEQRKIREKKIPEMHGP